MKSIRLALAKGKLAGKAISLLKTAGYQISEEILTSRKLIFKTSCQEIELILVKAADVPIYIDYGAADLGIVGKDTLLEEQRALYEVLDLQFGQCKFVVAGLPKEKAKQNYQRVATKYPRFAREFFREKRQPFEVIELTGSIELAPLSGLAELILDIVETGQTLRENGLVIFEEICPLSARLVVNRVSMKTKRQKITEIIGRLKERLKGVSWQDENITVNS